MQNDVVDNNVNLSVGALGGGMLQPEDLRKASLFMVALLLLGGTMGDQVNIGENTYSKSAERI